jgi:hypothetical protein
MDISPDDVSRVTVPRTDQHSSLDVKVSADAIVLATEMKLRDGPARVEVGPNDMLNYDGRNAFHAAYCAKVGVSDWAVDLSLSLGKHPEKLVVFPDGTSIHGAVDRHGEEVAIRAFHPALDVRRGEPAGKAHALGATSSEGLMLGVESRN